MVEFPLFVELPGIGIVRFQSAVDILNYTKEEQNFYLWVEGIVNSNERNGINSTQIYQKLNQFNVSANNVEAHYKEGNLESVANAFINYFSLRPDFPLSRSLNGNIISTARNTLGNASAYGALVAIIGGSIDSSDPAQIRGIVMAHEALLGTGKAARKSVQDTLTSLLRRLSEQQLRAEERSNALDKNIEKIAARNRSHFDRISIAGRKARTKFQSDINESLSRMNDAVNISIDQISSVRRTFEEQMRLEAPVKYWKDKAREHRRNSRVAAIIGISYAIALVGYASGWGIGKVLNLVREVTDQSHQWQSAYVVLTLVLFLLTIAFWIGRLVSRTYVSQAHLAIDAEERATMVETYLALTKDNQIGPEERILVLGSLFRASSDGLVKDDGAPDLSIAGLASRAGSAK